VTVVAKLDQSRFSAEYVNSSLEFETLISDLSSRFINLTPGEVDGAVETALRRVCEFLVIDYAVLWQWLDTAQDVVGPTHSYPAEKGPRPEPLSQEQYPWTVQQIRAGRMVVVPALEEMPKGAAVDREHARLQGVKSNLTIPLSVGGTSPVGALAFNTTRAERDWPAALVKRLQLVAQVFANALARKRADEALREGEERLALAADSAEAGLWILDYETGVFWVTGRARSIFGFSPDEVVTMERFEASVHPEDRDLVRRVVERSARTGEPLRAEYRILTGQGDVRWLSSRGRPHFTSTGEPDRLMGVTVDVSERKSAQEALMVGQARLAAAADLAGLGFYEVDFGKGTMYVDDRFRELCGIPHDREDGLQPLEFWMEHLHPEDRDWVMGLREQLHSGRQEHISFEYRYLHPVRGQTWIHHRASVSVRGPDRRTIKSYGVLRDVTGSKKVEGELHDLSRRLIRAQEEERSLLARELHDDVSQRLAVLAIEVGRAEFPTRDGTQSEAMQSVREGLVSLSEDIHSLAYRLHPSILEELGLADALRTECERRGRQGDLEVSIELGELPPAVSKDATLCLFRVAQEALNNVARHSGATAATVTLRQSDGGLLLAVSDDGVGFDPEHPGEGHRLGLASMRERVQLVNGTLDIASSPAEGTVLLAWVPVEKEPA
jgi:PAS domain S-box-containing protein